MLAIEAIKATPEPGTCPSVETVGTEDVLNDEDAGAALGSGVPAVSVVVKLSDVAAAVGEGINPSWELGLTSGKGRSDRVISEAVTETVGIGTMIAMLGVDNEVVMVEISATDDERKDTVKLLPDGAGEGTDTDPELEVPPNVLITTIVAVKGVMGIKAGEETRDWDAAVSGGGGRV
jgi:hypothetical protein